ncbi:MAG: right-handed parallel beta-helix repeat-containing protein, partial [Paludibacter sp.]
AVKLDSLVSYISISNIVFDKYAGNGIYGVARNAFIKIENCAFQNIEEIGVKFYRKANNCIVNNCFLRDVRGRGISFVEAYKNTISNNSLKRIGMLPGRGISGVNGYVGIVCEIRDESRDRVLDQFDSVSNNNNIHHNTIDSTGYIGIRADGQYNTVEKNIINHAMLHMDDGGGLYCFNGVTKGGYFKNNFIYDCSLQANMTQGIYVDNKVYDLNVINNTVVNTPGSGIEINAEAHDNNIRGNVLFNNSLGVIFPDWGTTAIYGNKMYQNTIVSNASNKLAVQIMSNTNRYNVVTADSNYYVNPYTENIFQYSWSQSATFNLATWRTKVPYNDLHAIALTNKSTPKATAGTFFLFTNKTDNPRTVDLTGCGCTDLKSAAVNQLVLQAFSSQVLIKDPTKCTGIVNDAPFSMGTYAWPAKSYDNNVYAPDTYFVATHLNSAVSENEFITVYPNPAIKNGFITFRNDVFVANKTKITIFDLIGKNIRELTFENSTTLSLAGIDLGIYILHFKTDKVEYSGKLIVK